MATKLIYSHFVKNDLKEINNWYRKIDKKLLDNFLKEFRYKINFIKENPLSCELKYDENRIVFLKKFPFGIHYFYNKEKNLIEIYSVFHTARNPEQWKDRK
ncbi:type II toxin-antitoxin system RelE/ParE family toxin [Chryseobacterium sp. Ch-15]|uniref:Type II toxin-antitoxin system RelE/ParE family toxin n=1 Tax=Chryseobacterium muglaense TaxID=2893752 RepID=A0A9Q3UV64_9FLAO|nr:type II toxin-antitoxin system RelE/ParE family toxin [Chryseobacterium muglaense]MBD3904843.1 type II toxin-antitoxin system RelE/ParE family toxin [Chryseobacterium muglaense]MCC9034391.1 type II toxin-antitoxin system RelE/ParE family toxin [Chryseobacterium muglaense]MCM2554498.1 type II toxin-antitoxin system RelE/ParE family toxin [Chryseobacterium muglaense]